MTWNRRVWHLAAPIMVANITVPLLGLVDTAVVGHLPGPEYLGAVAVGAVVFNVIYSGLNFLRMGTTGLTAQSFGARDPDQVRSWLGRAVLLSVALGLVLAALQAPLAWTAFEIMAPGPDVRPLVENYFAIRIWSAPGALMNFALLGWFFGVQDTRAALATQVYMNGVNIVLDLWFVMGLGWGVEGVAWATLLAELSAAGLGLWIAARKLEGQPGQWRWERILQPARLKRMFSVNRDIFIRSLCLQAAFVVLTSAGARMGDTVLAANAVLLQFTMITSYLLDGFANAAEVLAGEAVGAGDRPTFRAAVRATTVWALAFSLVFALAYLVAGHALVDLLTDVAAVRHMAYDHLPWMIALPVASVWCFQLDGIFIGATRTAAMRNGMALSLLFFVGLTWVMVPAFGNHGLWAAFTAFMVMRGITLGVAYPTLARSLRVD